MGKENRTLSELLPGEVGIVRAISAETGMLRRFLDIGCTVGARVQVLGCAPFGDPCAYRICGAVIAIRRRDAASVHVTSVV